MRRVVADIETDNLLDKLTRVHSLCIRDMDTGSLVSCADQPGYVPIEKGLDLLAQAEKVYGHNFIRFDYPAIRKVYPRWNMPRERIMDTLVVVQFLFAHQKDADYEKVKLGKFPGELAGLHTLEAWGHRLKCYKGEYTKWCAEHGIEDPWSEWRPEMQTYCEQDTEVNAELVRLIRAQDPSPESIDIELRLAWYLAAQERNGVPFDVEKAIALQAKLSARREELHERLRQIFGSWEQVTVEKFTPRRNNKSKGWVAGVTIEREKRKVIHFNPDSRYHIANRLKVLYDWEPTEYTKTGEPQVDDKALANLDQSLPGVAELRENFLVSKLLGQLAEGKEAWLRYATPDGEYGGKLTGCYHIHGRIKQNHAITHRAAHSKPNLGQVPKVGKFYGAECRELFYVPDGWVLVGADASGLEARCLGHFLARYDGGAYAKLLLEGDVHTANQLALGLPEGKPFRDAAKAWFYAWMYGGGDRKLGMMLARALGLRLSKAEAAELGRKAKAEFLKRTPAFGSLYKAVQEAAKSVGYVTMPDGRKTMIRSAHAALNSLLQSAGAIIVKRWIVDADEQLRAEFGEQGWDGRWAALLWVHDEVQIACRPEIADRVAEILVSTIRAVTEKYKWRLPLDGEAKIGRTWRDTH